MSFWKNLIWYMGEPTKPKPSKKEKIPTGNRGTSPATMYLGPEPSRLPPPDQDADLRERLICASLTGIRSGSYQSGGQFGTVNLWSSKKAAIFAIEDADAVLKILRAEEEEKFKKYAKINARLDGKNDEAHN